MRFQSHLNRGQSLRTGLCKTSNSSDNVDLHLNGNETFWLGAVGMGLWEDR